MVTRSQGRRLFHWQLDALSAVASRFTGWIVDGRLQRMLLLLVVAALVVGLTPFLGAADLPPWQAAQPIPLLGWALWLLLVACALGGLFLHRQRLLAVLVLGGTGLAVSLVFVFLSAPDLALTQLMVEMVTLALMLLALNYLPSTSPPERARLVRVRDAGIAIACGLGLAALAYALMTRPSRTMAGEMLARSLPEAYGHNVVNVILVDFRGFDTFGEITVFAIAGLVVHALLRRARMAPEKVMPGPPIKLPVPADLTQIMFPLILTVSVFLFLRGHNAPGGGFVAGLVLAVPLLMQYVIQGHASVESRFGFDYVRCIGVGLAIALASGAASMLFGVPFLTSAHAEWNLPLIGTLELASAMGFDAGVYLVVFGAVMLMLSMMGTVKPSLTRNSRHGVIDPAQRSPRTGCGTDGTRTGQRHRRARRLRRIPVVARPQLRRDPRADLPVLRHQPADLRRRAPARRPGTGVARRCCAQPGPAHRSAAAGAGVDRHCHRLRDDRRQPGAGDPQPRRQRQRPCRRPRRTAADR